jgi:putative ABC transport system substrate-binding protein
MAIHIGRRDFITLLGGAVAWPLAARAQTRGLPVIGFLSGRSPDDSVQVLSAFHRGLAETGFAEGQNVTVEYRWARGQYARLSTLAAELVSQSVSVLVGVAGAPGYLTPLTSEIPIVFVSGRDPIELGLIKSFSRPGGNVTGSYLLGILDMEPKRLNLLHELVPSASLIGVILDSRFPAAARQLKQIKEAALKIGRRVFVAQTNGDAELENVFATLVRERVGALLIVASPYFDTRLYQLVVLAAKHRLPAMYQFREYAIAGGLISYGPSFTDAYRQAGSYTGSILKGAKPADLPVVQSSKFELVINRSTAMALGLEIPPTVLALADEVIE